MATEQALELLDPVVEPAPEPAATAPRLTDLNGKVVGLLENHKRNSDRFLDFIGEILQRDYGVAEVVRRSKPSASFPVSEVILAELVRDVDAVVTGVGD